MLQTFVDGYYEFFDRKLGDGSVVVMIVIFCILFVGAFLVHTPHGVQASILDTSSSSSNIVTINGEKYEVVLKKL